MLLRLVLNSPCSPCWSPTHGTFPASASWVLVIQACATTSSEPLLLSIVLFQSSYSDFNLLFPSDQWHWLSLHAAFSPHLYIFFREGSIQNLSSFLNWIICLYIGRVLYIFWVCLLLYLRLAKSPSCMGYYFSFSWWYLSKSRKVFNIAQVLMISFTFVAFVSGVISNQLLPNSGS